jgi:hypothetical protein
MAVPVIIPADRGATPRTGTVEGWDSLREDVREVLRGAMREMDVQEA